MRKEPAFATPGPAGLMVLAFYLICLWPIATGMVGPEYAVVLAPLGLAGALVQMSAGIIELRNGAILAGNLMMAFSAFMWYGCGGMLLKALHVMPANTAFLDGWVFLVMGLFMLGFTPAFIRIDAAASLFMIATDVFFNCAALSWLLGSETLGLISNWALPVIVISIIWQVLGQVLNNHFGKQVIVLGPPLVKPGQPKETTA